MGKYTGSVCKKCRKEKAKLFLKADKCHSNCILDSGIRKNAPGQHGAKPGKKGTEYARHLREKQKARSIAGLREEQFKNYYRMAEKMQGLTHENLLRLLETRLDNVVYRFGFAGSRTAARQLINHGHIYVNGHLVKQPGYIVKPGNKVHLRPKLIENLYVKKSLERTTLMIPAWLTMDKTTLVGEMTKFPVKEDFSYPIDASLIVELYSK
jgi:small subunit ribosomal protein S4